MGRFDVNVLLLANRTKDGQALFKVNEAENVVGIGADTHALGGGTVFARESPDRIARQLLDSIVSAPPFSVQCQCILSQMARSDLTDGIMRSFLYQFGQSAWNTPTSVTSSANGKAPGRTSQTDAGSPCRDGTGGSERASVGESEPQCLVFAVDRGTMVCEVLCQEDLEDSASVLDGISKISFLALKFGSRLCVLLVSPQLTTAIIALMMTTSWRRVWLILNEDVTVAHATAVIKETLSVRAAVDGLLAPSGRTPHGAAEFSQLLSALANSDEEARAFRRVLEQTRRLASTPPGTREPSPAHEAGTGSGGERPVGDVQQLIARIATLERENGALERECDILRQDRDGHRLSHDAEERALQAQLDSTESLQRALDHARVEKDRLETELLSLREAHGELLASTVSRNDADRLREEVRALRAEVAEQLLEVERLGSERRELEAAWSSEVAVWEARIHQAEAEAEEQAKLVQHYSEQVKQRVEKQYAEKANYEEQLAEAQARMRASEQNLEAVTHENLVNVMEFQQKEKQWQAELSSMLRTAEEATRHYEHARALVETQAKTIAEAQQAAEETKRVQERDLEELLHKIRLLSPVESTLPPSTAPVAGYPGRSLPPPRRSSPSPAPLVESAGYLFQY